jgi:hypothetical protein
VKSDAVQTLDPFDQSAMKSRFLVSRMGEDDENARHAG